MKVRGRVPREEGSCIVDGGDLDWQPPVQPCAHDRVLVCCTCSMTPGLPNQYALLAVIDEDDGRDTSS